MFDHVCILLVLVVWTGRLDDTLYSIYRAWNPVASNKFCKVPRNVSLAWFGGKRERDRQNEPVQKLDSDTKVGRHGV